MSAEVADATTDEQPRFEVTQMKDTRTEKQEAVLQALLDAAESVTETDRARFVDKVVSAAAEELGDTAGKSYIKQVWGEFVWVHEIDPDTGTSEVRKGIDLMTDQGFSFDSAMEMWQDGHTAGFEHALDLVRRGVIERSDLQGGQ